MPIKKFVESIHTKEWLQKQFCEEGLSAKQISNLVGCTSKTIYCWLSKYNIVTNSKRKYKKGEENNLFNKKRSIEYRRKVSKNLVILEEVYTKEWLYEQYHVKNLSLRQIAKNIGYYPQKIHVLMKIYDIPRRNFDEGAKLNPPSTENRTRGSDHHWWTGNDRDLNHLIRNCTKSLTWKKLVIERDKYKCIKCSAVGSGIFHIDHIKPFSLILFENNITSLEQALGCKELWDISNGRTLCKKCHYDTETYGKGTRKLVDELRASKISSDDTVDTQLNINTDIVAEHSI